MLDGIGTLIIFFFMNRDDFRNQSNIPGHALHETGLQRQMVVGTLVNSQQRRALAVPVINR